jgi:hypothetical protein
VVTPAINDPTPQKEHGAIVNSKINKFKNKFPNITESTTKNKIEFIHD